MLDDHKVEFETAEGWDKVVVLDKDIMDYDEADLEDEETDLEDVKVE